MNHLGKPLFFALVAALLTISGCSDESSTTSTSTSGSGSSSSGIAGPCVPWGTWKVTYEDTNTSCALGSDTVTVTQKADGSIGVAFMGDDTMPMSMCSPNPEPGIYTTNATISMDGCSLELTSHSSHCYSGESQCEDRTLKLQLNGDSGTGTILHKVCWCTIGDPMPIKASAQRVL